MNRQSLGTLAGAAHRLMPHAFVITGLAVAIGCGRQEAPAPNDQDRADGGGSSTSSPHRLSTHLLSTPDAAPTATASPRLTIASGTGVTARLDTTLDSSAANVGDDVRAIVVADVFDVNGKVALPAGTVLSGKVTDVQPARKVHKMASLAFRFDRATLQDGSVADISASEGISGKGWTKKQGAIIGGSAAGGALVGQLLGHDTKATIGGAVVGGAIATGIIMSNKGDDVVLSSGSMMDLTLDGDVSITRPVSS